MVDINLAALGVVECDADFEISDIKVELLYCDRVMLREIREKKTTRDSLALSYAMAMASSYPTNYERVNRAIIKRWSRSGLDYIKTRAWKIFLAEAAENKNPDIGNWQANGSPGRVKKT